MSAALEFILEFIIQTLLEWGLMGDWFSDKDNRRLKRIEKIVAKECKKRTSTIRLYRKRSQVYY